MIKFLLMLWVMVWNLSAHTIQNDEQFKSAVTGMGKETILAANVTCR